VLCVFVLFFFVLCPMLAVSLDCPLLIAPSVFSNIYFDSFAVAAISCFIVTKCLCHIYPWICSICPTKIPPSFFFLDYNRIWLTISSTAVRELLTHYGSPEFSPGLWSFCRSIQVFCLVFCGPLFFLLPLFIWPLYYLSFRLMASDYSFGISKLF